MNSTRPSFGTTRERAASVSYAEIEGAARFLMATGEYASVAAVRANLSKGSQTTIAEAMRRFWRSQAALNSGNPVALTRLPPEFAEAAVALWEQALRLAQQTASVEDNAAQARLEELKRNTDSLSRSVELREIEWDMAARVRERALADTRKHVNLLLKQLALATGELRAAKTRISDLEKQIEGYRGQLSTVIARAVSRNREASVRKPARSQGVAAPRSARVRNKNRKRPAAIKKKRKQRRT